MTHVLGELITCLEHEIRGNHHGLALSFLAAWALRLNQPIIQAINWTSYPLQLLLPA